MEKCQGICSYKHLVISVEQLKSGTNHLTPDGDTFQLFHISQIKIIMNPAAKKWYTYGMYA